jgi:hypothetical protein
VRRSNKSFTGLIKKYHSSIVFKMVKSFFNHSKEGARGNSKEYLDQMVLTESNYKTAILSKIIGESKLMKEISNK